MAAIISLILTPIAILNTFSGIVGSIWLAILGKWSAIGGYLIVYLLSLFAPRFLLLPGLIFAGPAMYLSNRDNAKPFVLFLLAMSELWTYFIMVSWCIYCFYNVMRFSSPDESLWPYLLLAYSLSAVPWTYLAWRENQASNGMSTGSTISSIGICISSIALMITIRFDPLVPARTALITVLVPLGLAFILQTVLMVLIDRERSAENF